MTRHPSGAPILEVRDLSVTFATESGELQAVRGASFSLAKGRVVALLGESGCGKSVSSLAIMGLIEPPGRIDGGSIVYHREDGGEVELTTLPTDGDEYRRIRGAGIAMIFQEPRVSLTPVYTIGDQIGEALRLHLRIGRREARDRAVELLRRVGIPAAERRLDEYPHQLSGGMCQRVMIAMALGCNPRVLIADEPTTALDVTIQAQVLRLLDRLRVEEEMSILLVTHDLGVVAEMADEVVVMYLGRIVERGPVAAIFDNPVHPYTRGLLDSLPRPDADPDRPLARIPGVVPGLRHIPKGCPFRGRCFAEVERCHEDPPRVEGKAGQAAWCWNPLVKAGTK